MSCCVCFPPSAQISGSWLSCLARFRNGGPSSCQQKLMFCFFYNVQSVAPGILWAELQKAAICPNSQADPLPRPPRSGVALAPCAGAGGSRKAKDSGWGKSRIAPTEDKQDVTNIPWPEEKICQPWQHDVFQAPKPTRLTQRH